MTDAGSGATRAAMVAITLIAGICAAQAEAALAGSAPMRVADALPPMKELPPMKDPAPIGSPGDHFGDGTRDGGFRYGRPFDGDLDFTYGEKPGGSDGRSQY